VSRPFQLNNSYMHGCPCGYFSDPTRECRCTGAIIQRYLSKVSGPLLDRIDMHIEVPAVAYKEFQGWPGTHAQMELAKNANTPLGTRILVAVIALPAMAGLAAAQTPQISRIQNAAPMATPSSSVARGELISIYGSDLTNGVTLESVPPTAPLTLAGTSVHIGGLPAPILFISPTQLSVQVSPKGV
jgi:Magnesium chelatase, subunit ChlI